MPGFPSFLSFLSTAFVAFAVLSPASAAVTPELLKDIQTRQQDSSISAYISMGDFVVFPGIDMAHGTELWKSDGTPAGTSLLVDIWPGPSASAPSYLTKAGNFCYFAAASGQFPAPGLELWKTDGTATGTVIVKDIHPAGYSYPTQITAWGDRVVFSADDGTHGTELWISDGTEAGTTLVKDLSPGTANSVLTLGSGNSVVSGGNLYFTAKLSGEASARLWKTDGTPGGTVVVGSAIYNPSSLKAYNGGIYAFALAVSGDQPGIWKIDTMTGIAAKVAALANNSFTYNFSMEVMGGMLYFTSPQAYAEVDLYKSNGTAAGTSLVKKLGRAGGLRAFSGLTGAAQEALYFSSSDAQSGVEFWKSNGTAAGTQRLMDLNPGTGDSYPGTLIRAGNRLFFRADRGDNWRHLWVTDGSAAGTRLLKEYTSGISAMASFGNNRLMLTATEPTYGREMWTSDGTVAGTRIVKDFRGTADSDPEVLVNVGQKLYFTATVTGAYRTIHVTDGTAAGTQAAGKINAFSESISSPFAFGNLMLFGAGETNGGSELYKTDGTVAGTARVKDIRPGTGSGDPQGFTDMGGYALFTADDGVIGRELWRTDGTTAGTYPVKDILNGSAGAGISQITRAGNQAFFIQNGNLWKTGGTEPTTEMVEGILPAASNLTASGGLAYFTAQEDGLRRSLWRSDGSAAGTFRVGTFPANLFGGSGTGYKSFIGTGGLLYFIGPGPFSGMELWRSDGTPEGTIRLLQQGNTLSMYSPGLAEFEGGILFWLKDPSGYSLWRSDGTAAGTCLVRHLTPPGSLAAFSIPQQVTGGGKAWFLAGDGASGYELWSSDGSNEGTGPVPVSVSPLTWSYLTPLRVAGSHLVFPLETDVHGVELHRIPLATGIIGADDFASWAQGYGLSGPTATAEAVPHGDGVANFLKYAFFLDGQRPDRTMLAPGTGTKGLPTFSVSGSGTNQLLRVEYIRRKGSGLSYVPKVSSTLQGDSFIPMTGTETVLPVDERRERVIREQWVDTSVTPKLFGVVEVR